MILKLLDDFGNIVEVLEKTSATPRLARFLALVLAHSSGMMNRDAFLIPDGESTCRNRNELFTSESE